KVASLSEDASTRGNLIGRIAALDGWPQSDDPSHGVLRLIQQQPAGPGRQQVVVGFVQGISRRGRTAAAIAPDVTNAIWKLLNTEQEEVWQLAALLESYGAPQTFGTHQNAETIQRMLRLAPRADAKAVQSFVYAPISKRHLAKELGEHRLALRFLQTLRSLPASINVDSRIGSLLGSSSFTNAFRGEKQRRDLLHHIKNGLQGRAKYYAASGMIRNKTLMTHLLADGEYARVKTTLIQGQESTNRADLLGKFLASESTIQYLIKSGRVDEVLEFDAGEMPKGGRDSILMQVVSSDAAVAALLDADLQDDLIDAIDAVENKSRRKDFYRHLTTRKAYAKILARQSALRMTLRELSRDQNWMARRSYIRLITSLDNDDVQNEPDLAIAFWNFATQLGRGYNRRECIGALLTSSWFLPQLSRQDKLQAVIQSLPKHLDAAEIRKIALSIPRATHAAMFLDTDLLQSLLAICQSLTQNDQSAVFRGLGQSASVQSWFADTGQPDRLIDAFRSIDDETLRSRFAEAILSSGLLAKQRENKELAPKLIAFAKQQPKSSQFYLAVALLSDYTTSTPTAKSDLVDVIVTQIDTAELDEERLLKMISSPALSSLLRNQKLARNVIDLAFKFDSENKSIACQTALLRNVYFQSEMTDAELKTAFDVMIGSGDSARSIPFIAASPLLVPRLIQLGYFDTLRTAVDKVGTTAYSRASVLWMFYTNAAVVKQMQTQDIKADVLAKLLQEVPDAYLYSRMLHLLNSRDALHWLLDTHRWKPIGDYLDRLPDSERPRLIRSVATNMNLVRALAERDKLARLLDRKDVRDSLSESGNYSMYFNQSFLKDYLYSTSYIDFVRQIVKNERDPGRRRVLMLNLRRNEFQTAIIQQGQGQWLLRTLLDNLDESATVQQRESELSSDSGLFALAVRMEKMDEAEKLLKQFIDDDRGKLRLIRFRQLTGQLTAADTAASLSMDNDALQSPARLDFYLARATQQYDIANSLLRHLEDPGLAWAFAVEQQHWELLARTPVCRAKQLPVPTITNEINPVHRKTEELSFQIAFGRLAGDSAHANSLDLLSQWISANRDDVNNVRVGSDALLTLGQSEKALALLDEHLPERAFFWHWARMDYDRALEVINWDPTKADERFDRYAEEKTGTTVSSSNAIDRLVPIARLLQEAGRSAEANTLIDAIICYPERKLLAGQSRLNFLTSCATKLYQGGFPVKSRQVMAKIATNDSSRREYFSQVYADRFHRNAWHEALIWWDVFQTRHADETMLQRLTRVDSTMTATAPINSVSPFPKIGDIKSAREMTPGAGVPATLYRYKRFDEARDVLQDYSHLGPDEHVLLGRIHAAQGNASEAAESFHDAWQARTTDMTLLYLSGHFHQKAGNATLGQQHMRNAKLLAVSMENLLTLAIDLDNEGLFTDAAAIFRVLIRTAPPGHRVYRQSLVRLGLRTDDADQSVAMLREHGLYLLRPVFNYTDAKQTLHASVRLRTRMAESAIESGDYVAAEKEWIETTKINPGATWVANTLVPK
ncbi:MAG: hypothetical protein HKN47_07820, partial [Pirellulaceae bacterium]|nr:hypothetical protein [Pirellulaceae bacterium]